MTEPPLPEESIFARALEITSATERAAFLDQACGPNQALRVEVETLLRVHEQSGDVLDLPEDEPGTIAPPTQERRGTVIGPYKLLEQIGEGGMGTVWMAEQTDPIQRPVAVKVIKEGMDSRQVLARFDAERQALALMEHPHIAKVLDAGRTPTGRPYFIMELVKGRPITNYCDEHRLGVRDRLILFGDVCRAVQHAHQKGIIHRDLKPSNILVARYDGKPVVKVIDFGVAKATGQRLTDKTLFTGFGALVGTPEYMSPEQAEVNNQDIDTRSDIYSLGVLLYELLTGSTPLTRKRIKEAALLEVLRVIREEEPPRPSTRLSESKDSLPSISAQRQTEPANLTKLVRGELDWIVMKALEKDRNRRYETANGFAADVERYLADEPVQACPPSAWYRFHKFVQRNRGRFVAAVVLALAMAVAIGVIGWTVLDRSARQTQAANEMDVALDRAEFLQGQGKRAEALAAFERAKSLAGQARTDPARNERLAAIKARLASEERDQQFIARLDDIRLRVESRVHVAHNHFSFVLAFPEIRDALDHGYGIKIGATVPAQAAAIVRGRPDPVRSSLVAALDRCLSLAPNGDAQTREWLLATLAAADSDPWRVHVRRVMRDADVKTLKALARVVDVRSQPPSFLLWVAESLAGERYPTYATAGLARENSTDSIQLELLRRVQRDHPTDLWANHDLGQILAASGRPAEAVRYYTAAIALRPDNAGIYLNRGIAFFEAGEMDAAIADYHRALALAPKFSHAHNNLGNVLRHQGKVDEAIACYHEAIRLEKDHPDAHCNLGVALADKGQVDEAIAEYREAIRLRKDYPEAQHNLGIALAGKEHVDEAIACYQKAIALNPKLANSHYSLGVALAGKGQLDEAIVCYQKAIALNPKLANAHYSLGDALLGKGQADNAIACLRRSIGLNSNFYLAHYDLGIALAGKGQVNEAITEYREVIRLKKDYAQAHCNLGLVLEQTGRFREALEELRRGHEIGSRSPHWANPSAEWVRQCERLIELDEKLLGILEGKTTPASPDERLDFAALCYRKRLHRSAVRLCAEAFAAQPALASNLGASHRYNAACAAALAGCGAGQDADKPDGKERGDLRHQALGWLRADLDEWRRLLGKEPKKVRAVLVQQMGHWLKDPDLAGVRGPHALAQLPETERKPWQKLWDDVATTLARAQADTASK
jgi:serine/threonine protein kinase/tetratricopeptide (TPR) repeat protein